MIKFVQTVDGIEMIGLGLSYENLKRLKMGDPIKINLNDMGLGKRTIFIFAGRDEATMAKKLKSRIGPDTKVTGI